MSYQIIFKTREDKVIHLESLKMIQSIRPKIYIESGSYQRLDYIVHKKYGNGFVEQVINRTTIKVFFMNGDKILKQREYPRKLFPTIQKS